MSTFNRSIGIFLLHLLLSLNNFNEILSATDIYEGSSCQWKGVPGICTLVENCVTLQNYLITGKLYLKDVQQCRHNGTEMIACCTDSESIRIYHTKRDRRSVSELDNSTMNPDSAADELDYSEISDDKASKSSKAETTERPAVIACNRFKKYAKLNPRSVMSRIFGGHFSKDGELPHVVALGYGDSLFDWKCAGALISRRFVLTSAKCTEKGGKRPTFVRVGQVDIRESTLSSDVRIKNIIKHEDYVPSKGYNDIALLKLAKKIAFAPNIYPACLYTNTEPLSVKTELTISGWGISDVTERETSDILQTATVHFVPSEECAKQEQVKNHRRLPNGVLDTQLCAYDDSSDLCPSDDGAPLEIRNDSTVSSIVGIASVGLSCGAEVPSVYTRVASYLDWIEPKVWPKLKN